MLIVADVHAEFDALATVAARGEPLLILGDLLNFIDYRTGRGLAEDVYGADHTRQLIENRRTSNWDASRALWRAAVEGREDEMRARIIEAVADQHAQTAAALRGANAYVTFGNVDWPTELRACLPDGVRWVDGEVIEIDGYSIGFAGGGAPSVGPLYMDVITGREERSSDVVLEYVKRFQPRFHYFGDVHQPQAHSWQVGKTSCRNVGYFRATRRAVRHG